MRLIRLWLKILSLKNFSIIFLLLVMSFRRLIILKLSKSKKKKISLVLFILLVVKFLGIGWPLLRIKPILKVFWTKNSKMCLQGRQVK